MNKIVKETEVRWELERSVLKKKKKNKQERKNFQEKVNWVKLEKNWNVLWV